MARFSFVLFLVQSSSELALLRVVVLDFLRHGSDVQC